MDTQQTPETSKFKTITEAASCSQRRLTFSVAAKHLSLVKIAIKSADTYTVIPRLTSDPANEDLFAVFGLG